MLTLAVPDWPTGSQPIQAPSGNLAQQVETLYQALKAEREERIRLIAALQAWHERLGQSGMIRIADGTIDGTPIGNNSASTAIFSILVVGTSSSFPTSSTTPTVTSGSGTLTTASSAVVGQSVGNRFDFTATVTITTNGTGATDIRLTLPFNAAETTSIAGWKLSASLAAAVNTSGVLIITNYDGTYPGADGAVLRISGSYRKA